MSVLLSSHYHHPHLFEDNFFHSSTTYQETRFQGVRNFNILQCRFSLSIENICKVLGLEISSYTCFNTCDKKDLFLLGGMAVPLTDVSKYLASLQ